MQSWYPEGNAERRRMLRHACRTLIKKGDPKILAALGYTSVDVMRRKLTLENFSLGSLRPKIGDALLMSLRLRSTHKEQQILVVDYAVYYRRANGELSPKIFKWKNLRLESGQTLTLEKIIR